MSIIWRRATPAKTTSEFESLNLLPNPNYSMALVQWRKIIHYIHLPEDFELIRFPKPLATLSTSQPRNWKEAMGSENRHLC